MTLERGTKLGPYQIESPIGAGGMGEVYKATDTRLERTVAIKVLPAHVASDPERKRRFEREAKTVAALSHPHICPVFDVGFEVPSPQPSPLRGEGQGEGDAPPIDFLVMEYLEGETLADRLSKGALPLDQALRYAIEIADALDKAHRQGVTHRDLKPANIMLTKAGAKLLDFGLAKLKPTGPQGEVSTKLADALTEQGTILGTFQYMAPEQLEGHEADSRSDIWAFGCVVYEMVTGKKAFEGTSQASLIAAIIEREPATVSSVEPMTPAGLDYVVSTCLGKDPDDRWQSARDLLRELMRVESGGTISSGSATAISQPAVWQRPVPATLAAVFLMALAGLAVWVVIRPTPPRVIRTVIATPPNEPFDVNVNDADVAISPDGTRIVYAGRAEDGGRQLYVRPVDQLEAMALPGLGEYPRTPFISPDGNWVGYFDGLTLMKVSILGGPPVTICEVSGPPRGASWGSDDTIIFGTGRTWRLWRVGAAGGEPEALTTPNPEKGEAAHWWPEILPDGRTVLFTILRSRQNAENAQIALLSLDTGEQRVLVPGGSNPHYVPTGHLVYGVNGTLRAVGFDLGELEVIGDPVPVLEEVVTKRLGSAGFGVANDGTLVYMRGEGSGFSEGQRTLVWVDRDGQEEPVAAEPRAYANPRISPDGTQVALEAGDQENDIWIWHFERETLTRLTFVPGADMYPVWTPDGQRVAFASSRGDTGVENLFWKAADGTGAVEQLTEGPNSQFPTAFSPDATRLVFSHGTWPGFDLGVLSMDGERRSESLLATEFAERNPELSPDGHWLAYQSDASGQNEIYVRPFPNVNEGRWQVSPGGGSDPLWGPDGRELFYRVQGGGVAGVAVETDPSFRPGNREVVFEGQYVLGGGRAYDISPDDQRFLMIKGGDQVDGTDAEPQLVIVQNWFSELERLVPTP